MAGLDAALEEGAAAALLAGAELVLAVSPQAARLSGKATTAARAAILVALDLKFMIGLSEGTRRGSFWRAPRC